MKSYILSPLAEQDLLDIWSYIAVDNIDAADMVIIRIRTELQRLLVHPQLGHHRNDLPLPDLRCWTVYSYLIFYRVAGRELQVARIIHGSRDIPAIFNQGQ